MCIPNLINYVFIISAHRFVDNFSQGTRGALSAEHFLLAGYAVVFLHRHRSYEPFKRHFEGSVRFLSKILIHMTASWNKEGTQDRKMWFKRIMMTFSVLRYFVFIQPNSHPVSFLFVFLGIWHTNYLIVPQYSCGYFL